MMQGLNRVDPAGPPRRHESRTRGDHRESTERNRRGAQIGGHNTEELRRYISAEDVRTRDSQRESCSEQAEGLPHHHPKERALARAECHAQADLPGPARHRQGHQTVETDRRQQSRQNAKRRRERRRQTLSAERLIELSSPR